jgi:hypothetical protein
MNSCSTYDAGSREEAIRIATVLRVLFHDSRYSTSLWTHLKVTGVRLLSTGEDIPRGAGFWANLTNIELDPPGDRAEFVPKLDSARTKRLTGRLAWWEREFVYVLKPARIRLTRRDLVLAAANKDGGAHVDALLDPHYEVILSGAGWSITTNFGGVTKEVRFKNAHLAALRQMAYEVLNSHDLTALAA